MSSSTSTTPATPHEIQEHDILFSSNARYLVLGFSGEGYFGKVAKCVNLKTGKKVAVKVHKDNDEDFIQNELEMLQEIGTLDPDKSNIVTFFEGFRFHNFSCLTFEMLDKSLLDVMREQQRPMHLNEIRPITRQLLEAFDALKSIGILHLDLKPDNIMFVNHKDHPFKLKLIDFGLAQRVCEVQVDKIIQPISYQAPEVALGLPLSEAMDMWGVGCVMGFMYFRAHLLPYDPYDWMRTMVHLLGQPEDRLLNAAKYSSTFFSKVTKDDGSPGWRLMTSDEYEEATYVQADIRMHGIFDNAENLDDAVLSYPAERKDVDYQDRMAFLSLLKSCLNVDPQTRATPREALMKPFITMVHPEDVLATSSHADEVLQILHYSHLKHVVEPDDSLNDSGIDSSYCSLGLAGAGYISENLSAEQADIESNGDADTDDEDYRSEDEHTEKDRSSDTDSCICSLNGYDADCSDDSSTDGDPHTSVDYSNVESSADEDVIQPSSMRCSDSLPFTDEDNIVPVYSYPSGSSNGHSEGEMFNQESDAAPTSAQIFEITDCGPIASEAAVDPTDGATANISTHDGDPHTSVDYSNVESSADEDVIQPSSMRCSDSLPFTYEDNIVPVYSYPSGGEEAAVDPTDGATANTSTHDGAAAATQPAVQRKKFRNIRKFFSRVRRRVISLFNN